MFVIDHLRSCQISSNYRSSEEEITVNTGIEKGFEHWADYESGGDDETIDEKGVDPSEEIDFNVVPILRDEDIGNFDEFDKNFVRDSDYLTKVNLKKAGDNTKSTFLAETEGAAAVR